MFPKLLTVVLAVCSFEFQIWATSTTSHPQECWLHFTWCALLQCEHLFFYYILKCYSFQWKIFIFQKAQSVTCHCKMSRVRMEECKKYFLKSGPSEKIFHLFKFYSFVRIGPPNATTTATTTTSATLGQLLRQHILPPQSKTETKRQAKDKWLFSLPFAQKGSGQLYKFFMSKISLVTRTVVLINSAPSPKRVILTRQVNCILDCLCIHL